ncbi:MAG TPA: family 10 glycosylhydrolase, partial [Lacipirellulaceae bacterium]|nr:family 10 glycosylhydrolase [Lacipirellulaceae bacterium]
YSTLYADARKWEREGWLDYLTPQLYWTVESEHQSYPKLLRWWAEQNVKERHLWPGNFTSRVGDRSRKTNGKPQPAWTADEIIRQIEATRETTGATGNVQFSMKALMKNFGGIADKLKRTVYAEPALVPESPWLGHETPMRPAISARAVDGGVAVQMKMPRGKAPWQWLVRVRTNDGWRTDIAPGGKHQRIVALDGGAGAREVIVSGVSRLGREGPAATAKIGGVTKPGER